jgi:Tol biopolymer transport system component
MFSTGRRARSLGAAAVLALTSSMLAAAPAVASTPTGQLPVGKVFTSVGSTVRLLSAGGATVRTIVLPHHGGQPLVSPNGKWIAYQTATGLRMMAATGGHDRLLAPRAFALPLAWSPDSHRLVFTAAHPMVTVVNVETGALHPVLPGADTGVESAAYSPDGRYVLLTGLSTWKLIRTDSWTPRAFVKAPACYDEVQASWSPDGHRIAFLCGKSDWTHVEMLDLATGRLTAAMDPLAGSAAWSSNSVLVAAHYEGTGWVHSLNGFGHNGQLLWTVRVANRFLGVQVLH